MRLLLVLVIAACNHPPATPPVTPGSATPDAAVVDPNATLDRDLPRLAQRALALYKDVAQAFVIAGEDCAVATTKLGELQATYADVIAANAKVLHDHRAKELRTALAPHQAEFDVAGKAIMESKTLSKCAPDKAFEDAFDKLIGSPP